MHSMLTMKMESPSFNLSRDIPLTAILVLVLIMYVSVLVIMAQQFCNNHCDYFTVALLGF